MTTKFKVEFHWFNDNWEEVKDESVLRILRISDTYFVTLYNEAVNTLNPCYAIWNKLYDEQYAGKTHDCKKYGNYIADKANEHLAKYIVKNEVFEIKMEIPRGEDTPEIVGTMYCGVPYGAFKVVVRLRPM